jgi:hypothetical protein
MRDDIDKLPLPASAKKYARMHGTKMTVGDRKFKLYTQMVSTLTNQGRKKGFPSRDAVGPVRQASKLVKRIAGTK